MIRLWQNPLKKVQLLRIKVELFIATLALFFVACAPPIAQESLLVVSSPTITVTVEPTVTEQSSNVGVKTAVFTPTPTPSPIPVTETPVVMETAVFQTHTVQEGETLTIIADSLGTTTDTIQRANEIIDGDAIYVGQELEIPMESATVGELAEGVVARNILHNQFLCPPPDEINLEGGMVIGRSAVCHIPIVSHQFGEGDTSIVLVGGIHGGYEWNTILLAYEFIDYLESNPESIPASLSIIVIPNANPDGLFAVTQRTGRFTADDVDDNLVLGRFNGNAVDLNRNWDCEWTPSATWRDNPVSGGSSPFSEPESQSLRDFILAEKPTATVFFHSAATGVYASGCEQIDPVSERLTTLYSQASGYPENAGFQNYAITGDASNWLAMQGFPAITVELTTHESIDWRMNLAGLNVLIDHTAAQITDD